MKTKWALIGVGLALLTGCSAGFGPVVSQVQPLKDGSIRVRRCEAYVVVVPLLADGELEKCEWVTIQPAAK